jgi:hypothetical protein
LQGSSNNTKGAAPSWRKGGSKLGSDNKELREKLRIARDHGVSCRGTGHRRESRHWEEVLQVVWKEGRARGREQEQPPADIRYCRARPAHLTLVRRRLLLELVVPRFDLPVEGIELGDLQNRKCSEQRRVPSESGVAEHP